MLDKQGVVLRRYPHMGGPRHNPDKIAAICWMFQQGPKYHRHRKTHLRPIATQAMCAEVLMEKGLRPYKPHRKPCPDGYYLDKQGYLWTRIPDDDPMVSMRLKSGVVSVHRLTMGLQARTAFYRLRKASHHIDGTTRKTTSRKTWSFAMPHTAPDIACKCCAPSAARTTSFPRTACKVSDACGSTKIRFAGPRRRRDASLIAPDGHQGAHSGRRELRQASAVIVRRREWEAEYRKGQGSSIARSLVSCSQGCVTSEIT